MRALLAGGLTLCLAAGALGQHRRTYGSRTGFGNVLFPGTGSAPPLVRPFTTPYSTFAQRLGATISGFPSYTGAPIQPYRFGRLPMVTPWIYPVWGGGYYPPAYEQPTTVVVYPPTQPPVVIYQTFAPEGAPAPAQQETSLRIHDVPVRTPPPEPAQAPISFLLATKDHSVFSISAYWVEDEDLHYITPRGKHEKVPLAKVDRALSEKLNAGRDIEFRLPPAK